MSFPASVYPSAGRGVASRLRSVVRWFLGWSLLAGCAAAVDAAASAPLPIDTPMAPPEWALLERQLLDANVPACEEFFAKYFDAQTGYLQCFVRWGANDGPDDAFENFNRWPELHALGADDSILRMYLTGWEGMLKQYTEARTLFVPAGREGMYYKEFSPLSDWMHHGEGTQLFNRMGLSIPTDGKYQERARRFAGFYMNEDPEAPNYDPEHKIIRSLMNGSRGPLLRDATAIDWVGDPFDVSKFVAVHRETSYAEFIAHYEPYTDVVGDSFLNLVATVLPANAYLLANEEKYRAWIVEYMDAWLERMKQNNGIIPSYVDLEGRVGGTDGRWWGNVYGWGFSPIDPTNGRPANRNRVHRALAGFQHALLVTGEQKYVDAWRTMIEAVNAQARTQDGETQYPTMHGEDGWYGWQSRPWNVGAMQVWYWSMRSEDRERIAGNEWISYLNGTNPEFPTASLRADLQLIERRLERMRADDLPPERRLADNMLNYNPAATQALIQLMLGGLQPGVGGELLNARLRYFDPARQRAGVPPDVAALVSEMTDTRTVVTLVNLNPTEARQMIVQGGAYGEHMIASVAGPGGSRAVNAASFPVELAPGCGATLTLEMRRYAATPTILHPWQRE